MRCRYCGSKAIYPYKNHEQGGAGRVIAGAIIAGPIGALAGFAGKNVKGYRCSACGMFSEQAMDFNEELSINSAVRSAQNGNTLSYERYRQKYANLEFVPIQQTTSRNTTRLTTDDYNEELENEETSVADEPADDSVKHSYTPGQYVVGAPVFISNVTIKDDDGTDVLLLEASNISEKTLRSVYLTLTVYDDVGDQISTNTFAYQGLQAAPGESLQQAKPFKLNTNVAYKVDVTCEKAAFTDDSVWRKEENPTVYSVVDKTELTPESFAQYKYLRALLDKKSTLLSDRKLYYPVVEETHRLCVCGTPVTSGSKCPVCGLDEDALSEVMDYDVLRQARKDVIASIAKERTDALQELRESMLKDRYQEAQKLLRTKNEKNHKAAAEIFASISGYKDSDEQAKRCLAEAEECRKAETYQKAQALLTKKTEKSCKEAAKIFASLSGYKDSDAQAEHCITEAEVCRKDEIYSFAVSLMNTDKSNAVEQAIAAFKKIPGWKNADQNIAFCQQKVEELKAKEEAARIEHEQYEERKRLEMERLEKKKKVITISTISFLCAFIVFVIILVTVIVPNNKYNDAVELMNEGRYENAITAFSKLNGYKDSAKRIQECRFKILDNKYNDAIALMGEGKLDEAYSILVELGDYKDAVDKTKNITKERLKGIQVGSYIKFGTYEQDNAFNAKEDIEWLVLEVKDGKALVISKYILDCKQYNTTKSDITWELCSLRRWLNYDFINSAFSDFEKAMIPMVKVSADKNPEYDFRDTGNITQDKIFLLSITEANKYFSSNSARQCMPTNYAVANGVSPNHNNPNACWWLRSPGKFQDFAAKVSSSDGNAENWGSPVDQSNWGVRPAMWIDLNGIE